MTTIYRRPASRPLEILLVEDNPADVRLIQLILEDAEFHVNFTVANNGQEAMTILTREEGSPEAPRPDMILLDLNMPVMDGREVLAALETMPELGRIPVVVLTTSQSQEDLEYAYSKCISSYITKPVDVFQFNAKVRDLLNYWTNVAVLPD
ncbi:MAG: response regulator [Chloroflexi bacterium]|nr:response regulator [Chloroflexota bacterium]